jgi:hypothetical protein
MIKTCSIALAAAVLAAAQAVAAPSVDWDRTTSAAALSPVSESLRADFQALNRKLSAEGPQRMLYGIPQKPQDAFAGAAGCDRLDAMFMRAFSLDEAVRFLQPCAQGLSQRYGLPVTAEKGAVGVDGSRGEALGIQLRVPASIKPGNHILMDLSYSLRELRQGRLLGFPAAVISGSLDGRPAVSPQSFTGIPSWLDRKSLRIEPRMTRFDLAGELHVVLFDKDDGQVEFTRPAVKSPDAMVSFTRSTDEEAGPYSAAAIESVSPGELARLVAGVAVPEQLDASLRRSVAEFFASLR